MEKVKNLSLFFPAFNEAGNIKQTIQKALAVIDKVAKDYEIIIVDDGSIDGTDTVVKQLINGNKKIRLVSHKKNLGYGAALRTGFQRAKFELVVFNDGDGQFDFGEIKKFLEKIEKYDLVIGYRQKRVDSVLRTIIQFFLKIWVFLFFRIYYKDIDCGFKLFRKQALLQIMPLKSDGAMISTEILAKVKQKKLTLYQVPVSHYPRMAGKPTGANPKVILRAVKETIALKLNKIYNLKNL